MAFHEARSFSKDLCHTLRSAILYPSDTRFECLSQHATKLPRHSRRASSFEHATCNMQHVKPLPLNSPTLTSSFEHTTCDMQQIFLRTHAELRGSGPEAEPVNECCGYLCNQMCSVQHVACSMQHVACKEIRSSGPEAEQQ